VRDLLRHHEKATLDDAELPHRRNASSSVFVALEVDHKLDGARHLASQRRLVEPG